MQKFTVYLFALQRLYAYSNVICTLRQKKFALYENVNSFMMEKASK